MDGTSEVYELIEDPIRKKQYQIERCCGKGSFAKCYEVTEMDTKKVFAFKVMTKDLIIRQNARECVRDEIKLHQWLNHRNIVEFIRKFTDIQNVYIVLEFCENGSLKSLQQCRNIISEFECRYYIYHILSGLQYLHKAQIIHRDLKLANIFLGKNLTVKIGDFGLATQMNDSGELKATTCGTANYLAPEVINRNGYSYPVDVWAVGVIMYYLLVGYAPFETESIDKTYSKILTCDFSFPDSLFLSTNATGMIRELLSLDQNKRPVAEDCFIYNFFSNYFIPNSLPEYCLYSEPDFDVSPNQKFSSNPGNSNSVLSKNSKCREKLSSFVATKEEMYRKDMELLYLQLSKLLGKYKIKTVDFFDGDEINDELAEPLFWVSKWCYSRDVELGFGYQLCNGATGVMYNDRSKIMKLPNVSILYHIDKDDHEVCLSEDTCGDSKEFRCKIKIFKKYKQYMDKGLKNAATANDSSVHTQFPFVNTWFTTSYALIVHLTNGVVQINFCDHIKIIICPFQKAVTFINAVKYKRTLKFSSIVKIGLPNEYLVKLKYAMEMVKRLLIMLS